MKKITLAWLKKHDACDIAIDEWRKRKLRSMDVLDLMRLLVRGKKYDWANWLFCECANRKQQLKYAIHAAELALPIFEKEYPEDKRPRLAIEAAKRLLENDTPENRATARAAVRAARDAGDAAWEAARAVRAAALSAARAARGARWSAKGAGWAAAEATAWAARAAWAAWAAALVAQAAWSAARAAAWKDIINYGISLLEDK